MPATAGGRPGWVGGAVVWAVLVFLWPVIVPAAELSEQEQRGRQIYRTGTSPDPRALIEAVLAPGDTRVPGSVLPCVSCHGEDGLGRPEGGVRPSNITWRALTKPYGAARPDGGRTPPYTERLLRRAIAMGIDSGGERLDALMPRFRITRADMDDLLAYLKRIAAAPEIGLTDSEVRVGVVLPSPAHLPGAPAVVRGLLQAYFDHVNDQGGVFGRRLAARFTAPRGGAAQRARQVSEFVRRHEPFALTGAYLSGAEVELGSLIQQLRIPTLVAFALEPAVRKPPNRYEFHVLGGLTVQGQALLTFAARRLGRRSRRPVVVFRDESPWRDSAERLVRHCRALGWENVRGLALAPGRQAVDALSTVDRLRAEKVDLLALLAPEHGARLVRAAGARGWRPRVLVPGILAAGVLAAVAPQSGLQVYVSLPSAPAARGERARGALSWLQEKAGIPRRFQAAQVNALVTAVLLVEGLKRSGRALGREKLVDVLEGLRRFHTGLAPSLSYGPNRRIGARGAYIFTLERSSGQLVAAGGWTDSAP